MSTSKPSADRVTGNLQLRNLKSGPAWYAQTRVPGRDPEQTTRKLARAHLGGGKPPAGHLTRRQAQDALDEILVTERRKVGQRAYQHGPATFADAAAGYLHHLEHVRGREPSTIADYRGSIQNHLNPRWGERPVDQITPDDVEKMRDELLQTSLSPRTVLRQLTVAHGIFKYAIRKYGLASNPASAEQVDRPTVRYSGEFQTLDTEQLAALIRHAPTEQDAALYLTAAQTGMRQGELRALRWADIDFASDRIHVRRSVSVGSTRRFKPPKSGKVRSVPMAKQVAFALATLGQREHFTGPDDLVFANEVGEAENDTVLRRRYQNALKAAELPAIRFHDLRHIFGSTVVKAFPISDVQAMFGHAHITTTMRYLHHRPGAEDAAKITDLFAADSVPSPISKPDEAER